MFFSLLVLATFPCGDWNKNPTMIRTDGLQASKDSCNRRDLERTRIIKRKLRSVTRASASRDLCHILPIKKPRRGFDGKFIRPIGRPPVDGFIWNGSAGYWIPRGARKETDLLPRKAQSASSDSSSESDVEVSDRNIGPKNAASPIPVFKKPEPIPSKFSQDNQRKVLEVSANSRKGNLEVLTVKKPLPASKPQNRYTTVNQSSDFMGADNRQKVVGPLKNRIASRDTGQLQCSSLPNNTRLKCDSKNQKHRDSSFLRKRPDNTPEVFHHPDSMWQEARPPDESILTLYERHRKPRTIPSGIFHCPLAGLKQEFRCAICLDYIRNARVVKECLHRFCENCIEKALIQVGRRNECPICRVFVPTRRSLAPDPHFDQLIQCVMKDIVLVDEAKGTVDLSFLQAKATRAGTLQQIIRNKRIVFNEQREQSSKESEFTELLRQEDTGSHPHEITGVNESTCVATEATCIAAPIPSIVKLVLRRDQYERSLDELVMPFFTVNGSATVKVLRKFIEVKLSRSNLQLFTPLQDGKCLVHKDHKSLKEIAIVAVKRNQNCQSNYVPIFYRSTPQLAKIDSAN